MSRILHIAILSYFLVFATVGCECGQSLTGPVSEQEAIQKELFELKEEIEKELKQDNINLSHVHRYLALLEKLEKLEGKTAPIPSELIQFAKTLRLSTLAPATDSYDETQKKLGVIEKNLQDALTKLTNITVTSTDAGATQVAGTQQEASEKALHEALAKAQAIQKSLEDSLKTVQVKLKDLSRQALTSSDPNTQPTVETNKLNELQQKILEISEKLEALQTMPDSQEIRDTIHNILTEQKEALEAIKSELQVLQQYDKTAKNKLTAQQADLQAIREALETLLQNAQSAILADKEAALQAMQGKLQEILQTLQQTDQGAKLETVLATIQSLKNDLGNLQTQVQGTKTITQEGVQSVLQALQETTQDLQNKQGAIDTLQIELGNIQSQLQTLQSSDQGAQLGNILKGIKAIQESLTSFKTQQAQHISTTQKDITGLLTTLQATTTEGLQSKQKAIDAVKGELETIKNQLKTLEQKDQDAATQKTELEKKQDALEKELQTLQATTQNLANKQKAIDAVQTNLTTIQQKLVDLEQNSQEAAKQKTELKEKQDALEKELQALQTTTKDLQNKQEAIDAVKGELETIKNQLQALKNDPEAAKQKTELKEKQDALEKKLRALQATTSLHVRQRQQLNKLTTKGLAEVQKALQKQGSQVTEQKTTIATLKTNLEKTQQELHDLQQNSPDQKLKTELGQIQLSIENTLQGLLKQVEQANTTQADKIQSILNKLPSAQALQQSNQDAQLKDQLATLGTQLKDMQQAINKLTKEINTIKTAASPGVGTKKLKNQQAGNQAQGQPDGGFQKQIEDLVEQYMNKKEEEIKFRMEQVLKAAVSPNVQPKNGKNIQDSNEALLSKVQNLLNIEVVKLKEEINGIKTEIGKNQKETQEKLEGLASQASLEELDRNFGTELKRLKELQPKTDSPSGIRQIKSQLALGSMYQEEESTEFKEKDSLKELLQSTTIKNLISRIDKLEATIKLQKEELADNGLSKKVNAEIQQGHIQTKKVLEAELKASIKGTVEDTVAISFEKHESRIAKLEREIGELRENSNPAKSENNGKQQQNSEEQVVQAFLDMLTNPKSTLANILTEALNKLIMDQIGQKIVPLLQILDTKIEEIDQARKNNTTEDATNKLPHSQSVPEGLDKTGIYSEWDIN